jgi:hypothetical protein
MRVLLSGTSNAIIAGGLSASLAHDPRITTFRNQSYGASGSVALGDHIPRINFAKYDFCVLDYCVNEEVLIHSRVSTVDSAMNNLLAAVDVASRAGCQPLVLILPRSTVANFSRPFEEAIVAELATRGVPVFNFYTFAEQLTAQNEMAFVDLFLDPMHIHREIGAAIGTALVDYMANRIDVTPIASDTPLHYDPLHFVGHQDCDITGYSALMHRESSLLQRDCLALQPGATITLHSPSAGLLTGITFDAARTVGTLVEMTSGKVCLSLKPASAFFRETRSLTLMTLPISDPIPLDADYSTTLRYDFNGALTDAHPLAALTLSGVVLRLTGQARPVQLLTRDDGPTALQDWLTPDRWDALAATLAQANAS